MKEIFRPEIKAFFKSHEETISLIILGIVYGQLLMLILFFPQYTFFKAFLCNLILFDILVSSYLVAFYIKKRKDKNMRKDITAKNIDNPPLKVSHRGLLRSGESLYKSECPVCKEGLLLVMRNQENMTLEEFDRCILCGQAFIYSDIETMRKELT